jgi:hypothetical protein
MTMNGSGGPQTTGFANTSVLSRWACHCDSCRHATGALYIMNAAWPEPRVNVDISKLKTYHFAENSDVHFCGTCSTPMFFVCPDTEDHPLSIFTGTLDDSPENLITVLHHIHVGDTKDGGASVWLRKPNADGSEAKRFFGRSEGDTVDPVPFDWPTTKMLSGRYHSSKDYSLPIRCKCEGVNLIWYGAEDVSDPPRQLSMFTDPTTLKNLAGFCACDSCRRPTGVDVWTWAFAELGNITLPTSTQADRHPLAKDIDELKAHVDAKDPSVGSLTYYTSSPGTYRYFCGTCSACIFYTTERRPHIVDVAIGVLRASDGARAENFLSWAFGVFSRADDAKDGWRKDMRKRVAEECEEWRIAREYPKNWVRLARESPAERAKP